MGSTAGTERERGALTALPPLQRRRPCPDLRMAREGRGRPHAQAQLAPQPRAGGGGGGGWRQAGFHTVNYSVVNSAPRRGGGRESESEPSHSRAGTALSEEAGAPAVVLSGAKGPAGGQAQWGSGGPGHHMNASTGQRHRPLAHFPLQVQATQRAPLGGMAARSAGVDSVCRWQPTGQREGCVGHRHPGAPGASGLTTGRELPKVGGSRASGTGVAKSPQGKLWGCAGAVTPPWSAPPGWPSTTQASSFVRILLPWTCLGQSLAPFLICLETDQQGWGTKHQVSAVCGAAGSLQSWGVSGSPPLGKGGCEDRALNGGDSSLGCWTPGPSCEQSRSPYSP